MSASASLRSSTARRFSLVSFALAATLLLTFVSSSTALPTLRREPPAELAPESLFRRAAQHVGPTRPVERLRLRRDLEAVPHGRRNAENTVLSSALPVNEAAAAAPVNPKRVKRKVAKRATNPKAKRSVVDNKAPVSVPAQPANPKSKRAVEAPVAVPSSVVSNPKKRSVVEASISISPAAEPAAAPPTKRSLMSRIRRALAARGTYSPTTSTGAWTPTSDRVILVVPNPKSPRYPQTSASSSSTTTTTSKTTTRPATTTTSKATTTTRPVVTTTRPVATTTTTTAQSSPTGWPAEKMLAGAYYPSWVSDTLSPSQVNYRLYDVINFGTSPLRLIGRPEFGLTPEPSCSLCDPDVRRRRDARLVVRFNPPAGGHQGARGQD